MPSYLPEQSGIHTLGSDVELCVKWRMTHISGAVNEWHLPVYIAHYTHESLEKKMHTCTLCTSSIACESFWSASRIKSVSLWMMTSSWPCSSRGWLRSSCGDQDIGVLKATADAQEYNCSQRFTSKYELNYYSFLKKHTPSSHCFIYSLNISATKVYAVFVWNDNSQIYLSCAAAPIINMPPPAYLHEDI